MPPEACDTTKEEEEKTTDKNEQTKEIPPEEY
jgi:hypothetical protein